MGNRKDWSLHEINARKIELQDEINQIENKYSQKVTKIESRIKSTLRPVKSIRDKPLKALGASIALGFIIGISGRKKRKSKPENSNYGRSSSGFTSLLMYELKRYAAQRAMVYISDIVDQKVIPGINAARTKKPGQEIDQKESAKM